MAINTAIPEIATGQEPLGFTIRNPESRGYKARLRDLFSLAASYNRKFNPQIRGF